MKNSFVVYHSYRDTLKTLTDEQVGRLFRAILDYEIDCIEPQFIDGMVQMAFNFIKNDLDANRKKYDNVCERNRQNGQKGGRPKNPLGYLETQNNPEKPKKADNEYDNEYEYDNDINNIYNKRFLKPTVEQIKSYCQERNNGLDAQQFYDFYESKGWLVGKTKMKDWKASVRTWEKNGIIKTKKADFQKHSYSNEVLQEIETPLEDLM